MKHEIILKKLLNYINDIFEYTDGYSYIQFSENKMCIGACVFSLSQMGELCKNLSEDFKTEHSELPWHELYGLRNRIVHDYEGVNLKFVWQIIREDLPLLTPQLEALLADEQQLQDSKFPLSSQTEDD